MRGHHQVGQLGLGVGEVRAVAAFPLQVAEVDPAEVAVPLLIVTTRGAGAASTSGSSRRVSANGPRKLLPNCSSKPSVVVIRVGGVITPALLISTSTGVPSAAAPR